MYYITKWEKEQLDQSALTRTRHIKGVIMQMRYKVKDIKVLSDVLLTDTSGYTNKVTEITEKSRESNDSLKETVNDLLTLLGDDSGDNNYNDLDSLLDDVENTAEEYIDLLERTENCGPCFGGDTCNHSSCLYTNVCPTDDDIVDSLPEENEMDNSVIIDDNTEDNPNVAPAEVPSSVTPEQTAQPAQPEIPTTPTEITPEDVIREGTYYSPGSDGEVEQKPKEKTNTTIYCKNRNTFTNKCDMMDDVATVQEKEDLTGIKWTKTTEYDDGTYDTLTSTWTTAGMGSGKSTVTLEKSDGTSVKVTATEAITTSPWSSETTVEIVGNPSVSDIEEALDSSNHTRGEIKQGDVTINAPYGYFGDDIDGILDAIGESTGQTPSFVCKDGGANSSACSGTGTSYGVHVNSQQEADELAEKWSNSVSSANTSAASCGDSSACSNSAAAGCGNANASASGDGSAGCGSNNTTVNTGGDSGGSSSVCTGNVQTVKSCPGGHYNR